MEKEKQNKNSNPYKGWGYGVLGFAIFIAWWVLIFLFAK